ncbi:hypothetical protein [Herbiconiux flava]|uniref:Uncharacterized protein n=1 Tax=Herbiconiux flava TaxID=881268 RepID=A0A852SK86_9MICO|nr:hypothetical protein [Herbiconiux flava]NYD69943.1 hypothetical protein [Herbiconiux flava]GLK16692.1 hypothetical protein GCM10017602_11740 [Herbiconiux flava]
MGTKHYRRGDGAGATAVAPDPSDPYAAYLDWVAEGRPSLSGGLSTGPTPMPAGPAAEAPAIRVTAHVQVQDLGGVAEQPLRPSLWRRLTAFGRSR